MTRKSITRKATTTRKPKLDTGGRPKGKGKGGVVTQHGVTTTGYQRGCRCDECKAAAVDYKRKAREAKRAAEAKAAKAAKAAAKPKAAKPKTTTTTTRRAKKAGAGS